MTHQPNHQPNHRPVRSRLTLAAIGLLTAGVLITLGACQKTLLRPDDPRSPFDRYNQTRSQHAPPFLEDEFGRRTPNLRDRLVHSEE